MCRLIHNCGLVALSGLISFGSLIYLSLHGLVSLGGRIELLRHLFGDWKLLRDWPLGLRQRSSIYLSLGLVLGTLIVNFGLFINHSLHILLNSLRRKVLLPDVFGLILLNLLLDLSLLAHVGSGIDGRLGFNLHWRSFGLRKCSILGLHSSLVSLDWLRLDSRLGGVGLGLLWLLGRLLNWLWLRRLRSILSFLSSPVMLIENIVKDLKVGGIWRLGCFIVIVLVETAMLHFELHFETVVLSLGLVGSLPCSSCLLLGSLGGFVDLGGLPLRLFALCLGRSGSWRVRGSDWG